MKIVYITRFFWPSKAGSAAAIVTLELARRLVNRGHEVSLFVLDSSDGHSMAKREPLTIPKGLVVSSTRLSKSRWLWHTLGFVLLGFKGLRAACGTRVIIGAHHHSHLGSFCAAILSVLAGLVDFIAGGGFFVLSYLIMAPILGAIIPQDISNLETILCRTRAVAALVKPVLAYEKRVLFFLRSTID